MKPAPPVIRILFPIVIEPCTTVSSQYATSPIQQLGSSPLLFTGPGLEPRIQPQDCHLPLLSMGRGPGREVRRFIGRPLVAWQSFTPLDQPASAPIGYASWTQTPCPYSKGGSATVTATFASQSSASVTVPPPWCKESISIATHTRMNRSTASCMSISAATTFATSNSPRC